MTPLLTTSKQAAPATGDEHTEEAPILLSVVVPCFNEKNAVQTTLRQLERTLAAIPHEIIAVDDGSTDGTGAILDRLTPEIATLQVVRHPFNRGYGGALKTGIRHARGRFLAITDADGTYPNERIPELLAHAEAGADMVVGARISEDVVYSKLRAFPKSFMRRYCMWVTRQPIPDINSGLRVFKREVLNQFLSYLPNSFSFTTTVTIAFLTNQYEVEFTPISYAARVGKSKIHPITDTIRFVQLIVRTALYFAPLRVFGPLILLSWGAFLCAIGYDVLIRENFSEKSVLLLMLATNVSILALLADMIDKRLKR